LSATLVFGSARRSIQSYIALPMPSAASPGASRTYQGAISPTFSYQFETQRPSEHPSFSVPRTRVSAWIAIATVLSRHITSVHSAKLDASRPRALTCFTRVPQISTMTWSIDVLSDDSSEPDGTTLARAESDFFER